MNRLRQCIVPFLLILLVLLPATGCTKKFRVKWLVRSGNRDFDAEKYDAAESEFKKALLLQRLNPTVIGQLGRIYVKEGRLLDAHAYLAKATELLPNSLPFQLAYGESSAALHDFTNASAIAWRVLSWQPTNEDALVLLMDCFGAAAETEQRLTALPHIAENPAYHVALATLAVRQQENERADNEVRLALAANPNSSKAYFVLAALRARERDDAASVEDLKKAADLAPYRSAIRMKYIEYLIRNNKSEDARNSLKLITEKTPDYLPAWISLMNLSMAEQKFDEASKFADTIVDRDEYNFEGLLGRGMSRMAKGDADGAVIQFEHLNAIYTRSQQARYELGSAYWAAHNRAKAIENLGLAVQIAPDYPQANLALAQADIQVNDPNAAINLLSAYVKRVPTVAAQVYLLLAEADVMTGQRDDALSVYAYLGKVLPTNANVQFLTGIVLGQEERLGPARAAFEKALKLNPGFLQAAEQLINLDLRERNFKAAETLAQAQIQTSPKAVEPLELLAKVEVAETNLPMAETNLLKAVRLDPNKTSPYLLLSEVCSLAKNYKDALQYLNNAAARTNDPAVFMAMALLQNTLGDYKATRDTYEKILSVNSNNVAALNNLSVLYAEHFNDLDRAYELVARAQALRPAEPSIADTAGWILFKKGEYSRALDLLQDAAQKTGTNAEIQYHLGMANYMLDQEEPARDALRRAISLEQDFPGKDEARSRLAVLDSNPAAGPALLSSLEKAHQEHPDDPVVLNRLAVQQEKAGQWEKAAATYEAALQHHAGDAQLVSKLAWLYTYTTPKPDRAQELAKEAHRLASADPLASAVLGHWALHDGDPNRAVSLLEAALERLPNQPQVLLDLAWAYYGVGRVADSVATMQKALQNGAESGEAKQFVSLADAFENTASAQAATSQARQILQTNPAYVPALMISGVASGQAGDFKAAQDAFARALKVFPQFVPAARQLAIVDARHFPDDPRGLAAAEKARAAYQDDAEVVRSLGILSFYQAKYPRSAELLQESVANGREDGELYYYLGMDYYQLKRGRESKQTLERALALRIPEKMAADARKALETLK